ncbi:MAG: hypothetical protein H8E31_14915 [Planctomycetes bacterium]|nr:hypothetical protein [Planctomycetota bacterium]
MELLPAAERNRRALAVGVVLALLGLQALWPEPWLERAAGRLAAPAARVLAPLSAWLSEPVEALVQPPPSPVASLASVEEGLGRPPRVPGTVWWPVPVLERRSSTWTLGAGRALGLFQGQPVVFGTTWLGRLESVSERNAVLRLWTSPDAPTGAWIGRVEGGVPAICLGRRQGGEPLVRQVHPAAEPADGDPVYWRRREGDPPWFERGQFRLGFLRRRGDEGRREGYWAVETALPVAAEGRVYIGLGAIPPDPPAERLPERAAARPALGADGVYGSRLVAIRAAAAVLPEPTALVGGGRVIGPVVTARGSLLWAAPLAPESWPGLAVALEETPFGLSTEPGILLRPGAPIFSRGDGRFPRGLWLGRIGEPAFAAAREMEVVGR